MCPVVIKWMSTGINLMGMEKTTDSTYRVISLLICMTDITAKIRHTDTHSCFSKKIMYSKQYTVNCNCRQYGKLISKSCTLLLSAVLIMPWPNTFAIPIQSASQCCCSRILLIQETKSISGNMPYIALLLYNSYLGCSLICMK